MAASPDVIKALAVAAELCGTTYSAAAAEAFADELGQYPEAQVLTALRRCAAEVRGRLTLAEVVSRLDDGRPGPDEAWAMLPWDEEATGVLTEEMSEAMGIAAPTYHAGDRNGARFAFREAYTRLVTEARSARRPVAWSVSLGWDRAGRAGAIREAVSRGRLTPAQASRYLPAAEWQGDGPLGLPDPVRGLFDGVIKSIPAPRPARRGETREARP